MRLFACVAILLSSFLIATIPTNAQWMKTNGLYAGSVYALAVRGTNLFAGTYYGGVFLSTDNGTSWTSSGLSDVAAFTVSGPNLFAGTYYGFVFLSTNDGTSWTEVDSGLVDPHKHIYALTVIDTNLFAGTDAGVFLSTNSGTGWTEVNSGLTKTFVSSFAVSGNNLFVGTYDGGVFLSTNFGTSWTEVNSGLTNTIVRALYVSGVNLFAGTYGGGVFLSTNNGTDWTEVNSGLSNTYVGAFAVSGSNLFAGTDGGIFLSTNNGNSWTEVNSGFNDSHVLAFTVCGANLFAGTLVGRVWRRPLSEMITSAEIRTGDVPMKFSLEQNYPNPFNPATTISFSLPAQSFVSLKVFNALGREVSELVSDELQAGTYLRQWNAAGLASGMYFYRLQAGQFSETKKLVLIR